MTANRSIYPSIQSSTRDQRGARTEERPHRAGRAEEGGRGGVGGGVASPVSASLDVRNVDGGVEEHLRDDEVRPGINLFLDVVHLYLEVGVCDLSGTR